MKRKTKKEEKLLSSEEILNLSNRRPAKSKGLIELGSDNWLLVQRESDAAQFSIPKYCRVKSISFMGTGENKREKFTIVDWPHSNNVFSVKALPDSRSRFSDIEFNVGAVVEFDYRTNKLTLSPGNITVNATFDNNNKLKNGEYLLSLPDAPHRFGQLYLDRTSFALTWFFINDNDSINRYLHCGDRSEGCLTVGERSVGSDVDIRKWTEIASLLSIQRYSPDDKYVGKLIVKGLS